MKSHEEVTNGGYLVWLDPGFKNVKELAKVLVSFDAT